MFSLTVRGRILALAASGVLALVAMGGLLWWTLSVASDIESRTQAYQRISHGGDALEINNQAIRLGEKDFVLSHDLARAQQVRRLIDDARAQAEALAILPEALPVRDLLQQISQGMTRYGAAFDTMIAAQVRAGLDENSGLQGDLRQAVHFAEEVVRQAGDRDLLLHLLMMRRFEKDYLLRAQPDQLKKIEAEYQAFQHRLEQAGLDRALRDELAQRSATYFAGVAGVIQADQASRAAVIQLGALYDGFSPAFGRIRAFAEEQDQTVETEARAARARVIAVAVGLSLAAGLGFLLLSGLISRSIVHPVRGITQVMLALAAGDKTVAVPFSEGRDEIAAMARSVRVFKDGMIHAEQLESEARIEQGRALDRGQRRDQLTAGFDEMIRGVIGHLAETVRRVHATSTELHAAADQTRGLSATVAAAAEEASCNIQTVANAAEELGCTTMEISQRVQDTSRLTQEVVEGMQGADRTIDGLSASARTIGEIVTLIGDIAAQTNLLALNATIEAARAGEAGKGFAVVAGEVKSLATQTARATSDIAAQIAGIQASIGNAVAAIKTVSTAIARVDEVVTSIAAAIEEQNAATQEIVRNVSQAAGGNQDITHNIAAVSSSAFRTGEVASTMYEVAGDLEQAATTLGQQVETFLGDVKRLT